MDTATNRQTVVGVFSDRAQAERAVRDLEAMGFTHEQIGLLTPHGGVPGVDVNPVPQFETHAGSGAAAGVVVGGVLGAAAALLIPGIGPVIAGGILAAALGGAAVGAVAGGIVGALVGMGIPETEARYYEGEFRQGRSLVLVHAGDRYDEVRNFLRKEGAYDVHEQRPVENLPPPVGDLAPAAPPVEVPLPRPVAATPPATPPIAVAASSAAPTTPPAEGEAIRIPLVEEEVVVHKHPEQVGEVVIRKNVVEETRTIEVPVSREEIVVDERPASRPVGPGEQPFQEGTIRVPVTEEEVSAEKRAHVVGEVVVEKENVVEQRPFEGTVRREEAEVERKPFPAGASTPNAPEVVGATATGASVPPSRSVALKPWTEARPVYQEAFQKRFGNARRWEEAEPGYRFGHAAYGNPRYAGRPFAEVEPNLRQEWEATPGNRPWIEIREYVILIWQEPRARAA